tara:strand:- start:34 stop:303 length:270 start_codon:yes stop_codon:yes gene_type:complete
MTKTLTVKQLRAALAQADDNAKVTIRYIDSDGDEIQDVAVEVGVDAECRLVLLDSGAADRLKGKRKRRKKKKTTGGMEELGELLNTNKK